MNEVDYLVNLAEVQGNRVLAPFLDRQHQSAPFDRMEWWASLARHCRPADEPLIAVKQGPGGGVALPLMRHAGSNTLESLATWYSFWARPVSWGRPEISALMPDLARGLAGKTHRITLAPLPRADADLVEQAFRAGGWSVLRAACDVNHYLAVDGRTFAQYWATRPTRLRETVRRKSAGGTLQLRIEDRFSPNDWADYEAIYRASWKPREGSPAFLRDFAESEGRAGTLRLGIASISGRPVAAQFWTVEGGTAFIHKLAHVEDARDHSPGSLLTAAMMERAIDVDRVSEVDFGTGDDPYKRDWMDSRRPRYRLDMHWTRDPRAWAEFVMASVRHLRRVPA